MLLSMKRKEGITDHYFESKPVAGEVNAPGPNAQAVTLSWSMQCTQKKELYKYPAL